MVGSIVFMGEGGAHELLLQLGMLRIYLPDCNVPFHLPTGITPFIIPLALMRLTTLPVARHTHRY